MESCTAPRERHIAACRQLARHMEQAAFAGRRVYRTLWEAMVSTGRSFTGMGWALADATGQRLSRRQLVFRALLLADILRDPLPAAPAPVGVLLPTSVAGVVTLFALQARGWLPAMINFASGIEPMVQACRSANIRVIITARIFVAKAGLQPAVERLAAEGRVLYLEDLRAVVGPMHWLRAGVAALSPLRAHRRATPWLRNEHPALLMFTSGSEGIPKGVLLSHLNLLANCAQVATRLDFSAHDTLLNVLPLFHTFGLTMGTLAPLFAGMRVHLLPSPLDYDGVPALIHAMKITVLAGTDTFLFGYGRVAHPQDFASLRFVFAGAEPLRDRTRALWLDKFGLRVLEGYGTTETSPVLSVNAPFACRAGSVGPLLPGIEHRLEPVAGLARGGRLWVRGANIMLGYLTTDSATRGVTAGWYDTGDVVEIDAEGFLSIVGRAKRFAKIGGEMVSLVVTESLACTVWPDAQHAAIARPDPQKGEQIILVTTAPSAQRSQLLAHARAAGLGEIHLPRRILFIEQMPLLGVGKIDYAAVRDYAETS
ncbi:MAG: AMP-binding protein [Magnetococcales bacterium]|nr:AMP-binding protein [Magnetococcales bacterium]